VRSEGPDRLPVCDPETARKQRSGIYLAGVIVAGARTNEIFIENGRFHGQQIAKDLSPSCPGNRFLHLKNGSIHGFRELRGVIQR
jgi:hypothetical protein